MKAYTPAERQRIIDMIEAFELCRAADIPTFGYLYICHRLGYLRTNLRISAETKQDCESLIRRALGGTDCYTLDSYMRRQGMLVQLCDSHLRYNLRQQWLDKIIHDLTNYVRFGVPNT